MNSQKSLKSSFRLADVEPHLEQFRLHVPWPSLPPDHLREGEHDLEEEAEADGRETNHRRQLAKNSRAEEPAFKSQQGDAQLPNWNLRLLLPLLHDGSHPLHDRSHVCVLPYVSEQRELPVRHDLHVPARHLHVDQPLQEQASRPFA